MTNAEFGLLLACRDALERKHGRSCAECDELGDTDASAHRRRDQDRRELDVIQERIDTELAQR